MIRLFSILFFFVWLLQPAPCLTAVWDTPTSATVQWYQEARSCLSVTHATGETAFIGCYDRYPATVRIELGHGLTDGTARPQAGDVYVLVANGQTYRALLVARQWRVYVPAFYR